MSKGLDPEDFKEYSALGLGWSLVGTLVVCILGGVFLDQLLDTTPVLTLIGIVLGLISAGYLLYELTLINRKDREAGPVARKLSARQRHKQPPGGGQGGRVQ